MFMGIGILGFDVRILKKIEHFQSFLEVWKITIFLYRKTIRDKFAGEFIDITLMNSNKKKIVVLVNINGLMVNIVSIHEMRLKNSEDRHGIRTQDLHIRVLRVPSALTTSPL